MAITRCDHCDNFIDTDEFDFTEQDGKIYCDICFPESPEGLLQA